MIHTLDHMQRLHERCEEDEDRAVTAREALELSEIRSLLVTTINEAIDKIKENRWIEADNCADKTATQILEQVEPYRETIMVK